MRNFSLCFIICFLTAPAFLAAQSTAEEIETLLNTSAVTYTQAARFVLEASETLKTSDMEEAFSYAAERGWLPKNVSANDEARLDGISLLFMRSFGIKGGIFYSINKSPRYAYRELLYMEAIHGKVDPGMKVSGERLLFITGRVVLSQYGDTIAITTPEN